jgi:hypothetical protein
VYVALCKLCIICNKVYYSIYAYFAYCNMQKTTRLIQANFMHHPQLPSVRLDFQVYAITMPCHALRLMHCLAKAG